LYLIDFHLTFYEKEKEQMKDKFIYVLQRLLGFEKYLYIFSNFKIKTLKNDRKEGDFFTFLEMVNPGDCVLDIGANIGIMTYFLSEKVVAGEVFAFEPVPENLTALKKIISKHKLKNVTLIDKALGAQAGELEMVMPNFGKARKQGLSHVIHDSIDTFNEGTKYKVDVVTLDSVFENSTCKPAAIKLDVENFEYFVLKGGEKLITQNHPIIYTELWDNENRSKCMDILTSWGYKTLVVVNGELVKWDKEVHSHQNFIFLA
jgi:FkbM family methyltransferase